MSDTHFLRINRHWALAYDRLQWVLQNREGTRKTGKLAGMERWQGVCFVATDKAILFRAMRERGIEPDPEAQAVLEAMPDTFRAFLGAVEAEKHPVQREVTAEAA